MTRFKDVFSVDFPNVAKTVKIRSIMILYVQASFIIIEIPARILVSYFPRANKNMLIMNARNKRQRFRVVNLQTLIIFYLKTLIIVKTLVVFLESLQLFLRILLFFYREIPRPFDKQTPNTKRLPAKEARDKPSLPMDLCE